MKKLVVASIFPASTAVTYLALQTDGGFWPIVSLFEIILIIILSYFLGQKFVWMISNYLVIASGYALGIFLDKNCHNLWPIELFVVYSRFLMYFMPSMIIIFYKYYNDKTHE